MLYETFQHLRIRLPKWLTSWSIFFVDLIPAFIAYWFILITGSGLTGLSILGLLRVNGVVLGSIIF